MRDESSDLIRKDVRDGEHGSVVVEFAITILALYVFLFGAVELGRMVYASQILGGAARTAARDLAQMELPATLTFQEALDRDDVREKVFDPDQLVIDLDGLDPSNPDALAQRIASMPSVNQALYPLMISDEVKVDGQAHHLLRYPGALLRNTASSTGFAVEIPLVQSRGVDGVETVSWSSVLTETTPGAFSLDGSSSASGSAAITINYPFQSATLTAFSPVAPLQDGSPAPNLGHPILAEDASVASASSPTAGSLIDDIEGTNTTYSGAYGLGHQLALAKTVRPFRRILAGTALFRREVFE